MVEETTSSFGDAKCFPVRAVSFREGKKRDVFRFDLIVPFFSRQAIRLDFSITSYFILFFNDHLFLIDLHFLCRCLFTMKRTHLHSPKKRTTLLEVSFYIYLCCKTSGHATHPRYYAQLPWAEKPKKHFTAVFFKETNGGVCFSVCNPKIWLSKKNHDTNWYTKILHDFDDF